MRISRSYSKLGLFSAQAVRLGVISSFQVALGASVFLASAGVVAAQEPQARIAAIDSSARATLVGSHPAVANAANDLGRVSGATKLESVSVVFQRSEAQEAALQALLSAQQNPASPQYHKWLTPDQFAAQFGMASSDIAKAQAWLQQQGLIVTGVSRSHNRITFSGSVSQIEAAFGAEIHSYQVGGETHFAPASDLSVPAALAGSVRTVTNLSDLRPHPHVRVRNPEAVRSNFTSGQTGQHYLTPKDVATIYDVTPAYNAGYTGAGQTIAIVGQSAVSLTDITNFQNAAGLTPKAPTMVLVPNTGTSTVSTGDELESDLDLEYSGAIATGANITFVYTGNATNAGALDALQYAVDQDIAPIISSSYGDCEFDVGNTGYTAFNGVLAQAAAQGQTVLSAAGDDGSTDCYADTNLTTTQRTALGVDFPGSSQYVTSMGGTEFSAANVAATNTSYWSGGTGADTLSSALSYIPEGVWNDDSTTGLSSGGGGVSLFTPRQSWQANFPGMPAGTNRMVPDIALDASADNAPYLFCSSDTLATGITGSCANGFRDSSNTYLTTAGGTSFDAPIFAGMLALINQSRSFTTGQGVINNTLYGLASNASTYASAFHDIITGGNNCTAGGTICAAPGTTEYMATMGYDEASGLGSIDFYRLLTAWPAIAGSSALVSTTAMTAASATVAPGANDTITITVAAAAGDEVTTTPTGTVTLSVGGTTGSPVTLPLTNGAATYTFSSPTVGSYNITASYNGDMTYTTSQGQYLVTVAAGTAPTGTAPTTTTTFTMAATNVTVAAGGTGTSTVTVTPQNGYTGTVNWEAITSVPTLLDGCYSITNTAVSGTAPVTTTLTVFTDSGQCSAATTTTTSSAVTANVRRRFATRAPANGVSAVTPTKAPFGPVPMGVAFAGLLAVGFIGRRSRGIRLLMVAGLFAVLGLGMSGCGGSSPAPSSGTNAAAGVYNLTLTGTDSANSTITATAAVMVTVTSTSTAATN
jgi:subtilase family serine protease